MRLLAAQGTSRLELSMAQGLHACDKVALRTSAAFHRLPAPRRFQQLRDRKLAQASAVCEKLLNEATLRLQALARQEGASVQRMQASRASLSLSLAIVGCLSLGCLLLRAGNAACAQFLLAA